MTKSKIITIVSLLLLGALITTANADDEYSLYSQAQQTAKAKQYDFSFMHYRKLLREFPDTKYKPEAIFAMAEYYYLLPSYKESKKDFNLFIQNFSDSKYKIFALAYLLKIAQIEKDEEAFKELQRQIVELKQVSLVFRDSKEFKSLSPLKRKQRVVFYIDKIEFYVEGELLIAVVY